MNRSTMQKRRSTGPARLVIAIPVFGTEAARTAEGRTGPEKKGAIHSTSTRDISDIRRFCSAHRNPGSADFWWKRRKGARLPTSLPSQSPACHAACDSLIAPAERRRRRTLRHKPRPAHGTHFAPDSLARSRYRFAHGRPCLDSVRAFLGRGHADAVEHSRAAGSLAGRGRPEGVRRLRLFRPSRAAPGHELPFRPLPPRYGDGPAAAGASGEVRYSAGPKFVVCIVNLLCQSSGVALRSHPRFMGFATRRDRKCSASPIPTTCSSLSTHGQSSPERAVCVRTGESRHPARWSSSIRRRTRCLASRAGTTGLSPIAMRLPAQERVQGQHSLKPRRTNGSS